MLKLWVHYKMWDLSGGLASTVRFDQQYYKTSCCSQIHAVFAQNEAPLCCLELLFEINTTVSTLMLFWVRLFLQSCFFFFKMGNYDLFLLLKKMMVLEHNTPVFMFVFFTIFFFTLSLYLSLSGQRAFINNCTAFFFICFYRRPGSFNCSCAVCPIEGSSDALTVY